MELERSAVTGKPTVNIGFKKASRHKLSLRARNFNSDKLKVNDKRGNPIEIGAVVVWRVQDTAQASFDVEDFENYVRVQSESALRHLASGLPALLDPAQSRLGAPGARDRQERLGLGHQRLLGGEVRAEAGVALAVHGRPGRVEGVLRRPEPAPDRVRVPLREALCHRRSETAASFPSDRGPARYRQPVTAGLQPSLPV